MRLQGSFKHWKSQDRQEILNKRRQKTSNKGNVQQKLCSKYANVSAKVNISKTVHCNDFKPFSPLQQFYTNHKTNLLLSINKQKQNTQTNSPETQKQRTKIHSNLAVRIVTTGLQRAAIPPRKNK
jgi:hypothetical protein